MTALVFAVLAVATAVMSLASRGRFWPWWGYGTLTVTFAALALAVVATEAIR